MASVADVAHGTVRVIAAAGPIMPIWAHQVLSVVGLLGGAGAGLGLFVWATWAIRLPPINDGWWPVMVPIAVLFVGLPLGGSWLGVWWVERYPAHCPQCGSRAYIEGHWPIRYRCRGCGHLEQTRVWSRLGAA
jgi:hypothetical protein